jgi:hypothetical protein
MGFSQSECTEGGGLGGGMCCCWGGGVLAEGGVMLSGSIANELGLMSAIAWAFGSFAVVGDTEES